MSARTSLAKLVLLAAGLMTVVAIAPGCGRGVGSFLGPNQPPEIEIVDARGDRALGSGVRVRWAAHDPDGRVVRSRWRLDAWSVRPIADTGVHATTTEECFVPAADLSPARAASAGAREPQRFTLWAIDDRGARSEPATLAIYANGNIAPTVMITSPQPSALLSAQVGSELCIAWAGIDPDGVFTQKPVKYKFRILDLADPYNQAYLANPDSLRRLAVATNWAGWDSTSADTEFAHFKNLTPGKSYLFTVTGWDEAGDYDPIFDLNKNMLQFAVNLPQVIGPRITVTTTSFHFQYQSSVGFDDPSAVLETEVAAGAGIPFDWTAIPPPGQTVTGYRWVLDPVDPRDETPRSGPGDVRHWSEWTMTPSVGLGPFSPVGFKRQEHTVYLEARSSAGSCAGGASDFPSVAPVHFVVVQPTFARDLLVVDDTRLEPDRYSAGCPMVYTSKWPSAAELDTFLYARGGVPWRCTKNPPTGVASIPGILAGYEFDTLGTRGAQSGPLFPNGLPPGQEHTIPLSVLAGYRHVLWLTDVLSATFTNDIQSAVNPTTALRFMSEGGRVNVLSAYVKMGGQLWLAGGTAAASLLPWDKRTNNYGQTTVFSSLPQFGEIFPGGMVWEAIHARSEISLTNALQASRALGRFESAPGGYGALPPALESRTTGTDPLPPTRLSSQGGLFYQSTRLTEFITQPNVIVESGESALDSLYVVQGSGVPIGTGNVAMTVYHGVDNARCIWTGFDMWTFQRSECIALVDGVLQGIWGLSRAPVARGPEPLPALAGSGRPAPRVFTPPTRALRVHY